MGVRYFLRLFAALLCCLSVFSANLTFAQDDESDSNTVQENLPERPDDTVDEELVVTGSYIKGLTQENLASPLLTLSRDDMVSTGAFQVSELINNLTINTGAENNVDAFTQNFTTGTSNINLRGLGVASTLVLINGKRQTFSALATDKGENFVDTSSLVPMIAIDRVEVLKDGATSLYGSDAVAGVANFHTRKNFEGAEVNVEYQTGTADLRDVLLSGIFGFGSGSTHFMAAFSTLERDGLSMGDKPLSRPGDDVSGAGYPGSFMVPVSPPGGNPYQPSWGAAFDASGVVPGVADYFEPLVGQAQVPGALRPVIADPDCATIAAGDDTTVPGSDFPFGTCNFDFGGFYDLVPNEERTQLYATFDHEFSSSLALTAEVSYSDNEADRGNSPSFPITSTPLICGNGALDALVGGSCGALPAHPDNPFGTDVLFIGRILGSGSQAAISHHDSTTTRVSVSLDGAINDHWDWNASISQSDNEFFIQAEDTLATEFQNALVGYGGEDCPGVGLALPGSAPCHYFNPFGSSLTGNGTQNTAEIIDYISGTLEIRGESNLQVIDAVFSGEVAEVSDMVFNLATGLQMRKEELSYDYDENSNNNNFLFTVGNPDFSADRDVLAVFAELAIEFSDFATLQVALRNEDYDDEFSSTDPKIAIVGHPMDNLSLRASYGQSFRAPSLFQQNGVRTILNEITLSAAFLPVIARTDPGDTLQPETADIINLGASWDNSDETLSFDVDYWNFDYKNVIVQQDANAIVSAAFFGSGTEQAQAVSQIELLNPNLPLAPNNIARITAYYDNASTLETDGIDVKLSYQWPELSSGSYVVSLELTKVLSYDIADPQAGQIDGAGSRNFNNFATSVPELRSTIAFGWTNDTKHSVNAFLRNISSYNDDQNANASIDSHMTIDLQYNYTFDPFGDLDEGMILSVGGINVTDEDPPYVATRGGFDSKVHDPRGAMYYLKASVPF